MTIENSHISHKFAASAIPRVRSRFFITLSATLAAALFFITLPSVASAATCPTGSRMIASGNLQTEVNNTAAGGTLCLNGGTYSLSSTVTVNKSMTIFGVNYPQITQTFTGNMVRITSSNVTIQGLKMTGRNRTGTYCGGTGAIRVEAVGGINILDNVVDTFTCGFITGGTNGYTIRSNKLSNIKYAGIALFNGLNGTVDRNTLINIGHDGSLGENAYGISASVSGSNVSRNVTISNNYVKNAPTWECYDTHDGQSIYFYDNVCISPGRAGINSVNSGVQEVTDIRHERNYIDAGGLTSQWNSIVLTGTGNILNNTIRNFSGGSCRFHSPNATPSGNSCTAGSTDIIPPSIPTGPSATGISESQINLSWNTSTDNVGVTGYDIYRGGALRASVSGTSYSDIGLSGNTTYTYQVRAKDAAGKVSGLSWNVSAKTFVPAPSDTTPPSTPANLSATAVSSSQINLSWNASTDNVGVTGYRIERCQGAGCANFTQIATPSGTTYSDTSLAAATTYLFRARAADAAGNLSSYSTTTSATTQSGAGALRFSAATFSVAENVAGGNATITVTRTGGSAGAVGVSFATSNGTATAPADYTAVAQTVSFANGDTANKTISISIIDDTAVEGNETVNLALSNTTGGAFLGSPSTAVLTITDNDGTAPTLSLNPTTIVAGGTVTVTWSGIATHTATDWIGLYTPAAANTAFIDWIYVSCSKTPGTARASGSCSFVVPTSVAPGTYQLRLLANNGFTTLLATSNNFTVTGGVAPTLSVSPTTIAAGGRVTTTWSGIATPTATDWIGLYTPGAANTAFIDWIYVSCSKTLGAVRASGSCPFLVPTTVASGTYQLRLLANDGFTTLLATSNNLTVQ